MICFTLTPNIITVKPTLLPFNISYTTILLQLFMK